MPQDDRRKLEQVEEKLEKLKARRDLLEDRKEPLEKSELRFLKEFDEELKDLKAKEKYWQGIIEKGISYELTIAAGNAQDVLTTNEELIYSVAKRAVTEAFTTAPAGLKAIDFR